MDLERIRRKRQKNVQEQGLLRRESLLREARHYRAHPERIPLALKAYADAQGIDWSQAIILELHVNVCGGYWVEGELLTQDKRFIHFDLSTDAHHATLDGPEYAIWRDESDERCTSRRVRGTGVSDGAWALDIQTLLNGEVESDAQR